MAGKSAQETLRKVSCEASTAVRRWYRFPITIFDNTARLTVRDRDLFAGLIRLHVLHHASGEPIFGLGMIEELGRHGYQMSAGTLYPILHGLESRGYLRSAIRQSSDGRRRRLYRITPAGRRAFSAAKVKVRELFGELFEDA
jgi:PadR family transcriptional regulator PadR